MNLLNDAAELLGSKLKMKKLLLPEIFSWYHHKEHELLSFISEDESVVLCYNIPNPKKYLQIESNHSEQRLFIDSSHVSYVNRTAEQKKNTGFVQTGHKK